ncbi:MAG: flavodoxin family protein [Kiritimatiellaeota bacterium]|nr:flavodoxin family protein [Kiritimatiellota bacterium]
MNVLLVNGSPRAEGNTYAALSEVAGALNANGVGTAFFQLGAGAVHGCVACGKCAETQRCVFADDIANALIEKMAAADGVVIGSPVYYACANGALCAVLDRVFFMKSSLYAFKPAAAVVACRRGGASAAFDRLNKYFTISKMPVVSSQYWNAVHGFLPGEARLDREGMQQMRVLGENMAWMLKSIREGRQPTPESQPWDRMDFHHG